MREGDKHGLWRVVEDGMRCIILHQPTAIANPFLDFAALPSPLNTYLGWLVLFVECPGWGKIRNKCEHWESSAPK